MLQSLQLRGFLSGLFFSIASVAAAEIQRYGSLLNYSDLPGVLFLTGEIEDGDSFELRKAMRDQSIILIVTASPGGNLYEGLQIAAIVHDNQIGTYVPESLSCESSCANIFLGGFRRMVVGELGVHQFYSSNPELATDESKDATTSKTQYTTSDIIGIMNEFDTPPFVYEKMFGTSTMYYFKGSEKPRLNLNVDDDLFLAHLSAVDEFISKNPTIAERRPAQTSPDITAAASPNQSPETAQPPEVGAPAEVAWKRMLNVDFFGMDISPAGHRGVSIDECDQICRSDSNCAAWSYVTETHWCWPKYGVKNVSYAEGAISMVVDGNRISPGILDRPFLEITAKDIIGYDIFPKGLHNTSLEQCRAACEFSTACHAFSWVSKKNWCFPKYGADQFREQFGVISGVKRDAAP